jgi:hypothetical protein
MCHTNYGIGKRIILVETYNFLAHDLRFLGQIDGEVEPRITCAPCKKRWRQYEAILGNHNKFMRNLLVILCKYLYYWFAVGEATLPLHHLIFQNTPN